MPISLITGDTSLLWKLNTLGSVYINIYSKTNYINYFIVAWYMLLFCKQLTFKEYLSFALQLQLSFDLCRWFAVFPLVFFHMCVVFSVQL